MKKLLSFLLLISLIPMVAFAGDAKMKIKLPSKCTPDSIFIEYQVSYKNEPEIMIDSIIRLEDSNLISAKTVSSSKSTANISNNISNYVLHDDTYIVKIIAKKPGKYAVPKLSFHRDSEAVEIEQPKLYFTVEPSNIPSELSAGLIKIIPEITTGKNGLRSGKKAEIIFKVLLPQTKKGFYGLDIGSEEKLEIEGCRIKSRKIKNNELSYNDDKSQIVGVFSRYDITPAHSGEFTIPSLKFSVYVYYRNYNPYDSSSDNVWEEVEYTVESAPLTFTVTE